MLKSMEVRVSSSRHSVENAPCIRKENKSSLQRITNLFYLVNMGVRFEIVRPVSQGLATYPFSDFGTGMQP